MREPFQLTREERARILYSYEMRTLINTVEEIVTARLAADPGSPAPLRAVGHTPQIPTQDAIDWGEYQEWHISVWGVKPPEDHRVGPAFLAFRAGKARKSP